MEAIYETRTSHLISKMAFKGTQLVSSPIVLDTALIYAYTGVARLENIYDREQQEQTIVLQASCFRSMPRSDLRGLERTWIFTISASRRNSAMRVASLGRLKGTLEAIDSKVTVPSMSIPSTRYRVGVVTRPTRSRSPFETDVFYTGCGCRTCLAAG